MRKPRMYKETFSNLLIDYNGNVDWALVEKNSHHGPVLASRTYSLKRIKEIHAWLGRAIEWADKKVKP